MFRTTLSALVLTAGLTGIAMAEDKVVVPTTEGGVQVPTTPGAVVTVPTPRSMSAATPEVAAPPAGAPVLTSFQNDQAVSEALIAQGYSDVRISHDGTLMTVNAQRDGKPIELVYQTTTGQLVKLNGQPVLTEEQAATATGDKDLATTPETPTPTPTPEAGEDKDDGKPDDGASGGDGQDDGAHNDGASDDGASDDGASDDGSSESGASESGSNG